MPLHLLDARRKHRIVRRREGNLVDDDERQGFAAHIDAFPETLAADQNGVTEMAKTLQQIVLAPLALKQQGHLVTFIFEARLEQFMRAAHGAQAGAQEKGAAARRDDGRKRRIDHGVGVAVGIRFRHAERGVEHGLPAVLEGAFPAGGFRLAEAEFGAVVMELALHGQGRRSENPGPRMTAHLFAENFGDIERRCIQLQRMGEGLGPAHVTVVGHLLPLADALDEFDRTLPAFFQPLGPFGLGFEDGGELRHFFFQHLECRGKIRLFFELTVGKAPAIDADRQPQILRRFFHVTTARLQGQTVAGVGDAFRARIAGQIEHLRRRYAIAEKQRRHFRQLVRLVENHRVAGGQQFRHAFVAQHHIGEKEVVIDHHQIGRHRVAPRLHDEAVLVVRTLLAETVFARRGGVIPDRRIFGNFQTFRLVAALRHLGKNRNAAGIGGVFAGQETTVGQRPFKMVGTDVVGPPLEQRDLHRRLQGIANHRQILVEQLVLQGLRAGGNDHLAAGTQGRH